MVSGFYNAFAHPAPQARSTISSWLLIGFLGLFLVIDVGGESAGTILINVLFLSLLVWFYRDLLWDVRFDPTLTRWYGAFLSISFLSLFVNAWRGLDVPHAAALLLEFLFGYVIYLMAICAAREDMRPLMVGLVVFGMVRAIITVYAYTQALTVDDSFMTMKEYISLGGSTANKFAAFMLPIIPLCAVKAFGGRRKLWWGTALTVLLIGLVASLSRGAILGLAIGTVAAFPFYVRRLKWWKVSIAAAGAAALGAWMLPSSALLGIIGSRFQFIIEEGSTVRVQLWHAAWDRFVNNPVLGCGPGCIAQAIARENFDVRYSHSYLFDSLANGGILGTLCFLVILGVTLYRSASIARNSALGVGLFAAVVATTFHGLVEITFPAQEYSMVYWILAAMVTVIYQQQGADAARAARGFQPNPMSAA